MAKGLESVHREMLSALGFTIQKFLTLLESAHPQEKKGITGIDYEPWHFLYVGKKAFPAGNMSGRIYGGA